MENKKTKLTISGNTKKSIKNFNFVKNKGKKSVVIEKQSNKFTKKTAHSNPMGQNQKDLSHQIKDLTSNLHFIQNFLQLQVILKEEN